MTNALVFANGDVLDGPMVRRTLDAVDEPLIVAADGGTVTYAQYTGGYGNLVKISHGKGVETYYAHNSSFLVKVGDKVAKGQPIALMGSTGRSTGSHCHFEIRINGVTYNPLNYLP